ncbi:MAG: glycoside hydrolase family 2 [Clostridiales bacterium]|nr:glycoside hydrolase family 2 [Clostridiales bacterium]
MRKYSLNGEYRLYYADEQVAPGAREYRMVPAQVPGNVEIDLMRAGVLPDIFFGNNVKLLRPYEFYIWRYERAFQAPEWEKGERVHLHFEGVDCFADYYLNGQLFAHTENALIDHRFDVTELLREGENRLAVELHSPMLHAAAQPYDAYSSHLRDNYESLRVRKAPSAYGWDIMPRTLSAGLWRGVAIEIEGPDRIESVYLTTRSLGKGRAIMSCAFETRSDAPFMADLALRLTGRVNGEVKFQLERSLRFVCGRFDFTVDDPLLWWPSGYGDANVYDVTIELVRGGAVVDSLVTPMGIRTIKLVRADKTGGHEGEFVFVVNGHKVLCKGSNWVPADAMHSRDAARYQDMLALWTDTHCNIVRCWGGGVYEDHEFYDYCDRHGIMVWQDFVMACGVYPIDPEFAREFGREAEVVVRKLRNHPSIALWSGDNECDALMLAQSGQDPAWNHLTRTVLPDVIHRHDPNREYLPSSPYVSPEVAAISRNYHEIENMLPEAHLWGPRDYFKSVFYANTDAHFASETGYHGCNSLSSIKNFISADKLWPWQGNDEWLTHASEMNGPGGPYAYRIKLMADQIHELFGFDADNLEDFILASQISQAEAKKFFIEVTRSKKWRRTGVIWWNIIDGWPQFSDAVVSYDFIKKLAYHYIKRSQQDVCLMIAEPESWHVRVLAGNDTLKAAQGTFRVWDADSGETLAGGAFEAPANETTEVAAIRVSHGDHRLFLIEWTIGGVRQVNHYVLGKPPLSFERYKGWLKQIAALDNAFNAGQVGK